MSAILARMGSDSPRIAAFGGSERRVAVWLAAVAALAYLPFNHCHFSGSDETGVFEPARALLVHGDMAIAPGKHIFQGRDGRHYSHFAVGQSVLVLPLVAVGEAVAAAAPPELLRTAFTREYQGYIDTLENPVVFFASLYAPLASGVLLGLFFLFERHLGATRRAALHAALLLGATTYVATHSVFFLCHTTEAIAVLGSFAALHAWRRNGGVTWLACGSLCASSIVLIRVPATVAGPALAGYLLFTLVERWRAGSVPGVLRVGAAVLLPPLGVGALHLALNYDRWGTWIASPMLSQTPLLGGSLLRGLEGLLLSPGASLFVYSPLLLLLPRTLPPFWRAYKAECLTVLALAASFLLLAGRFVFWHGLWSAPGPRYLFVLTPLLLLPLGPWLDAARASWERALTAGLALLGCLSQVVLMSAHWRRTVEIMGYQAEISHVGFLFDPLRAPIIGSARALLAGEIDIYLWALWFGVPGRDAHPLLAAALLAAWATGFGFCLSRLRAALRRAP